MQASYPEPGTRVVITLQNNMAIDGIVEEWNKKFVLLSSVNTNNQLVIYKPEKNILFVKLIFDDIECKPVKTQFEAPIIIEDEIKVKPNEPIESLIEKHKDKVGNLREKVAAHLKKGPQLGDQNYNVNYGSIMDMFKK